MRSARAAAGRVRSPAALVALETALAATLGGLFLGSRSFSGDESVSVALARLPWGHFGHLVARRETNGSLYFAVLHALTDGNGGEAAIRAFSVVCAGLAVPIVFLLTRRLFGPRAALIAGLLFAIDPLEVEYSQVAREYILAVLLVILATYLFVVAVQDDSRLAWLGYSLACAAATYTFLLTAVLPPAHVLALAALPAARVPWRRLCKAMALFGALLVPLVYVLVKSNASSGVAWASGNLPGRIVVSIRSGVPRPVVVVVAAGLTLAVAVAAWRLLRRHATERRWAWVLLLAWLTVPLFLVSMAAFVFQPLFVVRYFLPFSAPGLVALAAVIARLRNAASFAAAGITIACVAGVGLARWYSSPGDPDFRATSGYVADEAGSGDGVLIYAPYVRVPFELYFGETKRARSGDVRPVYPATPWGDDPTRFIEYTPMPTAAISDALSGYTQVWVVLSQFRLYGRKDPGYDHVLNALAARNFALSTRRAFPGVEVRRYVAG